MQVHREAYPIDLHLDSLHFSLTGGFNFEVGDWKATRNRLLLWFIWNTFPKGQNSPLFYHVAGPDLEAGGYGGGCASAHGLLENITWFNLGDPWRRWEEHKNYLHSIVSKDEGKYRLTKTPDEVQQAKEDGLISLILSVEGAHLLGRFGRKTRAQRLERIRQWGKDGVAYVTLNHYSNTDISMAGYAPLNPFRRTKSGGLSIFGREIVQALIDNGILVDLTHTSTAGILAVCEMCSEQNVPVIVSHSASRTLTQGSSSSTQYRLKRTLADSAIREIMRTGGCISVILAPFYLQTRRTDDGAHLKDESLEFVVNYYERLADLISAMGIVEDPWDHLSFGSDFDGGIASIPIGMSTGADLPELTRAMLEADWPIERIKKVYSLNFLRVWAAARSVTT